MERVIGATILVGILIAVVSILRIVQLEKLAAERHSRVREAEDELRNLSQQLVHAQEEERRSLSRELHDQIGQLLTAIRIGLGNVEEKLGVCPEPVRLEMEQTRRISEQALRSVRDLAMGLRPAMLDDLGLGPALEWQARQHARLCGVPVNVKLDGNLDDLSDAQRTCVYRVVQEALNNIAKHASATDIQLEVGNRSGLISVIVIDNGRGLPAGKRWRRKFGKRPWNCWHQRACSRTRRPVDPRFVHRPRHNPCRRDPPVRPEIEVPRHARRTIHGATTSVTHA